MSQPAESPSADECVVDALDVPLAVAARYATAFTQLPRSAALPRGRVVADSINSALAELTRLAVDQTPLLCIHAGVVDSASGVIAVPGMSGLGKTTLTAALVQAGLHYLSDEALAIEPVTGAVRPFARALAMDRTSWQIIAPPDTAPPAAGQEVLIRPELLGAVGSGGGRVAHVILATRRPGPVLIEQGSRGAAVTMLLTRSFNHYRQPQTSFRCVVDIARTAQVWHVEYGSAPELAALLAHRFGQPAAADSK